MTDLSTLEARAAKAQAAYEAAQAAAQAIRDQQQAEKDARAREVSQRVVDNYDDAAMFRQIRQAREAFVNAVAESDIGKAWIAVQLAELRHAHASGDYNNAAGHLGLPPSATPHPASNAIVEQLAQIVDRAAADALAAEQAKRDAERAAYIAGRDEG
jgi:hypothetical protein